jgi:hypothetical protein
VAAPNATVQCDILATFGLLRLVGQRALLDEPPRRGLDEVRQRAIVALCRLPEKLVNVVASRRVTVLDIIPSAFS